MPKPCLIKLPSSSDVRMFLKKYQFNHEDDYKLISVPCQTTRHDRDERVLEQITFICFRTIANPGTGPSIVVLFLHFVVDLLFVCLLLFLFFKQKKTKTSQKN